MTKLSNFDRFLLASLLLAGSIHAATAQGAVSKVEYFFDNDPGIGNATPADASVIDASGAVNLDIPAADLAPGEHLIGFRAFSGKMWSGTITAKVLVPEANPSRLVYAEYFWGEDPGYGAGIPVEVTLAQDCNIENLEIDFPEEEAPEYLLSFRARSENGWSPTVLKVIPHLYVESLQFVSQEIEMSVGETALLEVTVNPEDAFNPALTFSSDNPEVAAVDESGLLTAKAPGQAIVTAEATDGSGVKAECQVSVGDLTGIETMETQERVYTLKDCIVLQNIRANAFIGVYTLDGAEVFSSRGSREKMTVGPLAPGIYIVVVDSESFKLTL